MTTKLHQFFKNKKVLVTGHTGFKGSWLTLFLLELGAKVTGLSLETEPGSLFEALDIKHDINHEVADIRDEKTIRTLLEKHQPEIVFHLAAQSMVRYSYDHPLETFSSNVIGSANVTFYAMNQPSIKAIVSITTDKVYENKEWIYGYRENDRLGGYDPYSASKACAELIASSLRQSYKNGKCIATVRAGNVIGGGDWAKDRLIPDCVRALSKNQPIVLRYPNAVRPWQHVLEPVSGYLWLAYQLETNPNDFAESWNFGPGLDDSIPVLDITQKVLDIWGGGHYIVENTNYHETSRLFLDTTKALTKLNWKPNLNINEAIDLTINWYKEAYQNPNFNAKEYTLNQIQNYHRKAQERQLRWAC